MITFTRLRWEDIPEALRKRVISWSSREIIINDTGLTQLQIDKITEYMNQAGFK